MAEELELPIVQNLRLMLSLFAMDPRNRQVVELAADTLEEFHRALNEISCPTQTEDLLWWQQRARKALNETETNHTQ